ncbi:hypothetical protein CTRI78_v006066 [Colletotrichum trifolii]|uniref:Uncharacterized protein n=1 Tax=Colletotrichum trifolii TaxID=5466 RepID=A0A4R8RD84_COLTR|nr:hypothetical protein CTRI78_v006066 [Colletotrichum trifolii]
MPNTKRVETGKLSFQSSRDVEQWSLDKKSWHVQLPIERRSAGSGPAQCLSLSAMDRSGQVRSGQVILEAAPASTPSSPGNLPGNAAGLVTAGPVAAPRDRPHPTRSTKHHLS